MPVSYTIPPASTEYAPYYARYVRHVPPCDIIAVLETQGRDTLRLLAGIAEDEAGYRYAPDKWSIKQVVGHIIETERVFAYRALAFSRNESAPLPGFDQDAYVDAANFEEQPWRALQEEAQAVRAATVSLFRGLNDAMMERSGIASGVSFTVRALAYIIVGHERHHLGILRERYGVGAA